MRRGTTPTLTFNLPTDFDISTVNVCEVYFSQNDELVFERSSEDEGGVVLSGTTAQVTLTQEETLLLDDESKVEVQVRFLFNDGSAQATGIIKEKVARILKDGEING